MRFCLSFERIFLFCHSKLGIISSCVQSCNDIDIVLTCRHLLDSVVFSMLRSGRHVKIHP